MVKTTNKLCKSCVYSKFLDIRNCYCDYFMMTYKRRECKVGYCDKYESKKGGNHNG